MKKTYLTPKTKVVEVKVQHLMVTSDQVINAFVSDEEDNNTGQATSDIVVN